MLKFQDCLWIVWTGCKDSFRMVLNYVLVIVWMVQDGLSDFLLAHVS